MKKWVVLLVAMMMVAGVQAKEKNGKGETKEAFVEKMQKHAEAAGKTFDKAKAEALFDKKDVNKDGVLSKDELSAKPEKKKKKSAE